MGASTSVVAGLRLRGRFGGPSFANANTSSCVGPDAGARERFGRPVPLAAVGLFTRGSGPGR